MRSTLLTASLALTLMAACARQAEPPKPAPAPAKPVFGTFGVDLAAMDKTVKPGDDFYKYVNGKWLETAQIPPDKSYYGTVVTVFENTEANLSSSTAQARCATGGRQRPTPNSSNRPGTCRSCITRSARSTAPA